MKFVTSLDRDPKVSDADAFIEFLSSFTGAAAAGG